MITIGSNHKVFGDSLHEAYAKLRDTSGLMQSIGLELESIVAERFETRSDPDGRPWAVWADSTRRTYPADGNGRLLDRYGDMLASLSSQADKTSVRVGFGVPYAAYHEWGTRHMPRRGLLFSDPDAGELSEEDSRAVLDIIVDFLDAI